MYHIMYYFNHGASMIWQLLQKYEVKPDASVSSFIELIVLLEYIGLYLLHAPICTPANIKLCLFVKVLIDCYQHLFSQMPAKHGSTTIHLVFFSIRPWQNP